ncbi:MAG: hydroxyacylglutathione hydrolase [Gammaproteobacteria bacterium]|nr:hydroxyacylglutathione hydrolase [Gammaproteobacteria bacterium]
MIRVDAIPAFEDNYIWLLSAAGSQPSRDAVVVDPGTAEPVIACLERLQLRLTAILITHHHDDHCGGITALTRHTPVPVYGPLRPGLPISHPLHDGDRLTVLPGLELAVISVPGHTRDHLAYYGGEMLFCGDTLFAGGCGRVFEGDSAQLYQSLTRLATLPETTRIYCAHEYTLDNLAFARQVEPDNQALQQRLARVRDLRATGQATIPSLLAEEHLTNPFLRCAVPDVHHAVEHFSGKSPASPQEVFKILRYWKDTF